LTDSQERCGPWRGEDAWKGLVSCFRWGLRYTDLVKDNLKALVEQAADVLSRAEALLICAGAGMGVDSGLPDFRGDQGFWKAYPPLKDLQISFIDMANPSWFDHDPALAWGFYGHRLNLYRNTPPHPGFDILRRWGDKLPGGYFVFTSNVDGHFQDAGFSEDRVCECHGSLRHLQCTKPCTNDIVPAATIHVDVDEKSFRASEPLPKCRQCGELARPNVLMFGDWKWIASRSRAQEERLHGWLAGIRKGKLLIIELGAGTAVPTVRATAESLVRNQGGSLVRINPREAGVPPGQIGIAAQALEILEAIDQLLNF